MSPHLFVHFSSDLLCHLLLKGNPERSWLGLPLGQNRRRDHHGECEHVRQGLKRLVWDPGVGAPARRLDPQLQRVEDAERERSEYHEPRTPAAEDHERDGYPPATGGDVKDEDVHLTDDQYSPAET